MHHRSKRRCQQRPNAPHMWMCRRHHRHNLECIECVQVANNTVATINTSFQFLLCVGGHKVTWLCVCQIQPLTFSIACPSSAIQYASFVQQIDGKLPPNEIYLSGELFVYFIFLQNFLGHAFCPLNSDKWFYEHCHRGFDEFKPDVACSIDKLMRRVNPSARAVPLDFHVYDRQLICACVGDK